MIVKGADGKIYSDDPAGDFNALPDLLPNISDEEKAKYNNVIVVGSVSPGPHVVQSVTDKMKDMTADLSAGSVIKDVGAAASGIASDVGAAAAGAVSGAADGMKKALILGGLGLAVLLIITR